MSVTCLIKPCSGSYGVFARTLVFIVICIRGFHFKKKSLWKKNQSFHNRLIFHQGWNSVNMTTWGSVFMFSQWFPDQICCVYKMETLFLTASIANSNWGWAGGRGADALTWPSLLSVILCPWQRVRGCPGRICLAQQLPADTSFHT